MSANLKIYNNIDLLKIPLRYDPLISDKPLYLPEWYQKEDIQLQMLCLLTCKVIHYDELCQKFSARPIFLNYLTVKCIINTVLTKFGYAVGNFILERPFVPVNLKYILKSKKGGWNNLQSFLTNFQNDHRMKSR